MITNITRLRYIPKTNKRGGLFCICLFRDPEGNLIKYIGKDIPNFPGDVVDINPEDKSEEWDGIPVKTITKIKRPKFITPEWVKTNLDQKIFKKYCEEI